MGESHSRTQRDKRWPIDVSLPGGLAESAVNRGRWLGMADDSVPGALQLLLRTRSSPLSFDPEHAMSEPEVELALEAAR